MGGYRSGRPSCHAVLEQQCGLDVRVLRRRGLLRDGSRTPWHWSRDGEPVASVILETTADSLELRYTVEHENSGDREQERASIGLVRHPCHFGGTRTYFRCPYCWGWCELIVLGPPRRRWACRKCLRLRYTSQRLAPGDRWQRRADALYTKAGRQNEDGSFVHKRKWMRWRTFNRLMDRANLLSQGADAAFFYRLQRLGFGSVDDAENHVLGSTHAFRCP